MRCDEARLAISALLDGELDDAVQARREPWPDRLRCDVRWVLGLRWSLGLLAVGQLMLAVRGLLGAVGYQAHSGREVAAFGIALSLGLLLTAWYPEHARVFAPVVFTLAFCLASISALDLLQGVVMPGRVAIHVVSVAQASAVWLLARITPLRTVPV